MELIEINRIIIDCFTYINFFLLSCLIYINFFFDVLFDIYQLVWLF